jgi:hypothetical protein
MPSTKYNRVPYTCQSLAEIANSAFLALIGISNLIVFSRIFLIDPLLQHQQASLIQSFGAH